MSAMASSIGLIDGVRFGSGRNVENISTRGVAAAGRRAPVVKVSTLH
jgi:hypothetical protein